MCVCAHTLFQAVICLEQVSDASTRDDHAHTPEIENPILITNPLQEFYCWNIYIIDSNIIFLALF